MGQNTMKIIYYLKVNILMRENGMDLEENIYRMVNYFIKGNIYVGKKMEKENIFL